MDEDTYVEQGLKWADAHFAYLEYIFGPLGVKADMLFLGNPVTDEFQHQFAGLLVPKDIDGRNNPYYDNVDGTAPRTDASTSVRATSAPPTTRRTRRSASAAS